MAIDKFLNFNNPKSYDLLKVIKKTKNANHLKEKLNLNTDYDLLLISINTLDDILKQYSFKKNTNQLRLVKKLCLFIADLLSGEYSVDEQTTIISLLKSLEEGVNELNQLANLKINIGNVKSWDLISRLIAVQEVHEKRLVDRVEKKIKALDNLEDYQVLKDLVLATDDAAFIRDFNELIALIDEPECLINHRRFLANLSLIISNMQNEFLNNQLIEEAEPKISFDDLTDLMMIYINSINDIDSLSLTEQQFISAVQQCDLGNEKNKKTFITKLKNVCESIKKSTIDEAIKNRLLVILYETYNEIVLDQKTRKSTLVSEIKGTYQMDNQETNLPSWFSELVGKRPNYQDYLDKRIFAFDDKNPVYLSIEMLENGNYLIGHYEVDVTNDVVFSSDLEIQALRKGFTKRIKLPDNIKIHQSALNFDMLPSSIVKRCHLRENENKKAIVMFLEINPQGKMISQNISAGLISVKRTFTSKSLKKAMDDINDYDNEKLNTLMSLKHNILRSNSHIILSNSAYSQYEGMDEEILFDFYHNVYQDIINEEIIESKLPFVFSKPLESELDKYIDLSAYDEETIEALSQKEGFYAVAEEYEIDNLEQYRLYAKPTNSYPSLLRQYLLLLYSSSDFEKISESELANLKTDVESRLQYLTYRKIMNELYEIELIKGLTKEQKRGRI